MTPSTRYRRLRQTLAFLFIAAAMGSCASVPKSPATPSGRNAVDDDSAVYVKSGEGSPAVVMQAGLGDDKAVWNPIIPDLSRDYTVIAFDRPGRGANPFSSWVVTHGCFSLLNDDFSDHVLVADAAELIADDVIRPGRLRCDGEDMVIAGHDLEVHVHGQEREAMLEIRR